MITVFFSWESDKEKYRTVIQNALDKAAKNTGGIKVETATRDEKGAIEIDNKIFEKIKKSDLYVADLSIIGRLGQKRRKSPNPNVLYETGFALSYLGEEKMYLVSQNEKDGSDKFPFDLRNRRIAFYNLVDPVTKKILTKDFENFFRLHNSAFKPPESKTTITLRENVLKWDNWSGLIPSFNAQITIDNYLNEKPNFIEAVQLIGASADGTPWRSKYFKIGIEAVNKRFKIEPYDKHDTHVLVNQTGDQNPGGRISMPDLDRDTLKIEFKLADSSMITIDVKIVENR